MSRTDFNPSTFDRQAAASLDYIDEDAAKKRVEAILAGDKPQAGLTPTPQPQTQPQAPAETMRRGISNEDMKKYVEEGIPVPAPRKKRSDAGIPKGPKAPADPDEITVKMSIDLARAIAMACAETNRFEMAAYIQDEVISQIKKRLDALQKQK